MDIEKIQFKLAVNFLAELKKEFGKSKNKSAKVAKLKKVEQKARTMEEFMQEFEKNSKKKQI